MNEPIATDRRNHDVGTRVALVEQALEFIRHDQADLKVGQTLILGRLDTFLNQATVSSSELSLTPAGRVVAERLSNLANQAADHDRRIGELDAWRDEIRGAVRVLSFFSALSSLVAALLTILHLAHIAGW